jgi:hypothetical protein
MHSKKAGYLADFKEVVLLRLFSIAAVSGIC